MREKNYGYVGDGGGGERGGVDGVKNFSFQTIYF